MTVPASGSAGGDGSDYVAGMYRDWFLDYASYVILDRAVPSFEDGLKPVQRRILHAMDEIEDGRFNKAANIIGQTMRYHPHGDAAIADALVKMAQKDLLIDTQGNWGNIYTGDSAAAPRYIEARLSPFAKEVLFNPKVTRWQDSYDGRNREPLALPVKFPLLLFLGVEGIAVGLSTKILPHNFTELLQGCVTLLKGKKPKLYPDFVTGGAIDVSNYNDGMRGGKVKVRATIEIVDTKTLKISEIPFGTTTTSLIDSILNANDKGKIKIKKVEDNTAQEVEILIHLHASATPETTIAALFAFTDCETSISPSCCIIKDDKPYFCGVTEVLQASADRTVDLLKQELEIRRQELLEKLHFAELERIFIEERIYRKIETAETWESVLSIIHKGLAPFTKNLCRPVTDEDVTRLTEIKIKRISKFDADKARDVMLQLKTELSEVEANLASLTAYAIAYFEKLIKDFGKGRSRNTSLETFHTIARQAVAASNEKLYVNRKDGFVGTSLKKDEFLAECSDLDDVIAICNDGNLKVSKVAPKVFMGKGIIHAGLFKKKDHRCIYHLIYRDGKSGAVYAKRFTIMAVTRDKDYSLTRGTPQSKVLYFSVNPNGEGEKVEVVLKGSPKDKEKSIEIDFGQMEIKDRQVVGNLVTKKPVQSALQTEKGDSTLSPQKIWYDKATRVLNDKGTGDYLGEFKGADKLLVLYPSGTYELTDYSFANVYAEDVLEIRKYRKGALISILYHDGDRGTNYAKRCLIDPQVVGQRVSFMEFRPETTLLLATAAEIPRVKLRYRKSPKTEALADTLDFKTIDAKGVKALGDVVSEEKILEVSLV